MTALEQVLQQAGLKQVDIAVKLTPEEITKYSGTGEHQSSKGNQVWFAQATDDQGKLWSVIMFRLSTCTNPTQMRWNGRDDNRGSVTVKIC